MEPGATQPDPAAAREWWWIFDPRLSLRAAAALVVGGSMLVFVAFMAWFAGKVFQRSLEKQIGPSFELLAQQVSDKIDRGIYERRHALDFAANLPLMRTLPGDAEGTALRRQLLDQLQKESPDFAWLGIANIEGRIVVATDRVFEGASATSRPWFRAGREGVYTGRAQELPELARHVGANQDELSGRFLELAVPLSDVHGRLNGVLGAYIKCAEIRDVAFSVIADTAQQNKIGVTLYAAPADVVFDSGASGWTLPPNAPSVPSSRRFRGSLIESSAMGTKYVTGYARSRGYRDFRGLGWLVTVRQPFDRAFVPVDELQRLIVHWGGAFAAMAAAGAWILAGRLARRLRSIGNAANRIREGDILTVLPRPRGHSEIAGMCDALATMVDDFRAKQELLADENARLTPRKRETETAKRE